jgi:hypothetical protein
MERAKRSNGELEQIVSRLEALIAQGNDYAALTLARIIRAGPPAAQRRSLAKVKQRVAKELAEVEEVHEEMRGGTVTARKLPLWGGYHCPSDTRLD